jgi:hypothetical protein
LQLVIQDLGALVVHADGTRPVARVGLQLHERSVSDLLERFEAYPQPAVLNGFAEVAGTAPAGHQVITEFDALAAQLFALRKHPVVVHPWQQIAAILLHRRCSMLEHRVLVAGRQRLQCQLPLPVEHAYVDAACRPVSPHQRGGLNDE